MWDVKQGHEEKYKYHKQSAALTMWDVKAVFGTIETERSGT